MTQLVRNHGKAQGIRLIDVFILGPWLILLATRKAPLTKGQRAVLAATGVLTVGYNARNYRRIRLETDPIALAGFGAPRVVTAPVVGPTFNPDQWTRVSYATAQRKPLGTALEARFAPGWGYSIWNGIRQGGYQPHVHRASKARLGRWTTAKLAVPQDSVNTAMQIIRTHAAKAKRRKLHGATFSGLEAEADRQDKSSTSAM